MKQKKPEYQISITGIVTPVTWDADDSVIAVTILTADEDEYLVSDNLKGEKLLNYLMKRVRAKGTVSIDEDGEKMITIKSFEILEFSTFPDGEEKVPVRKRNSLQSRMS